jgi:hypothetical protein
MALLRVTGPSSADADVAARLASIRRTMGRMGTEGVPPSWGDDN